MPNFLTTLQTYTISDTYWDETVAGETFGLNDKDVEVVEKGPAQIVIRKIVRPQVLFSIFYAQRGAEADGVEPPIALVDGMTWLLNDDNQIVGEALSPEEIRAYFVDHPLVPEFHPNGLPD